MQSSNDKKYYWNMVASVREKLLRFPEDSYIRDALSTDKINEIVERVERSPVEDLEWAYWPPLFLFLDRRSVSEIKEFEDDVCLIVKHSKRKRASEITQFMKARSQDDRLWVSGLFETFVKSRFLKEGLTIELDYSLPNGRNADIRLEMGEKPFCMECTVIIESDEDKEVWDRFLASRKADPNTILVRPGKFDPPDSKSPSPYYDTLRCYAKVYDKLTRDLDPKKSQMCEDAPNVLLISFYSPRAPLSPTSPGVGWALDELLADQPKSGMRIKDYPPGITDVSILAWLDFTAEDLHHKSRLDLKKFSEDFHEIIGAPRKIGGILLFELCSLRLSRVNYNAKGECRLSHQEIARLEKLLKTPPGWCH